MAQVSRSTFATNLATKINDNTSGDITPADIRETFTDLEDSAAWYDEVVTPDGAQTLTNKTIGAATYSGTQDFNGQQVEASLNKVVTSVSGTLTTTDHSGNILVTSGNVTVPTTAGFNCILIAGGAHTVTFNGATSAAMAAGDLMTIIVESGTVIHAVSTLAGSKVGFT